MKRTLSILLLVALMLVAVLPTTIVRAEESEEELTPEEVMANYAYNGWFSFDENNQLVWDGRDAIGEKGVVSSQRYEASQIGIDIMKKGGNAVDAAVATAFALGVCEPNANGLGGGGFMTLRNGETGEVCFIDFREVAPGAATEDMYPIDENGNTTDTTKVYGGKAIAVPGEVKGLLYILEKYGTMSRQEVMQPAIDLATNGFIVTPMFHSTVADAYKNMIDYPELGAIYLDADGMAPEARTIIKNPDLAKTLQIIADQGADGFYKGEVAQAIVDSSAKYGGIITMEDLANYEVQELEPVSGTYRGYKIISSPPPSSGGAHLIQILNILENFDVASMKPYSAEYMHLVSEAFKITYAERAAYMGDPKYVDVPMHGLMSKDYAKVLANKIDPAKAQFYEADDPWKYEGNSTSHLSVADVDGNMVAITHTINYYFGSAVVADGYGFILNNEMDDFSPVPGGPNSVAPGKKPLSSMSPTIVLNEDGTPFMVLGCPGGMTIFSQVAQVISHVIDHGMSIQEAINQPRIWDAFNYGMTYMDGIDEAEIAKLEAMGHSTSHMIGDSFGYVQGIQYGTDGKLYGGADPYTDCKAVGY